MDTIWEKYFTSSGRKKQKDAIKLEEERQEDGIWTQSRLRRRESTKSCCWTRPVDAQQKCEER